MPNIKSAKKRVVISEKKNAKNRILKSRMKTEIKKFEATVAAGNKEEASAAYREAVSIIDKSAAKGVIHKNAAAHKKAQMAIALNQL